MTDDVYYNPEKFGLEVVGDVEWEDQPYQFDMTVVWRDKETGRLYMASDSGCSCPSPFEDFQSKEDLTEVTKHEALKYLNDVEERTYLDGYDEEEKIAKIARVRNRAMDLIEKVQAL